MTGNYHLFATLSRSKTPDPFTPTPLPLYPDPLYPKRPLYRLLPLYRLRCDSYATAVERDAAGGDKGYRFGIGFAFGLEHAGG
jgi:hypothetical protein